MLSRILFSVLLAMVLCSWNISKSGFAGGPKKAKKPDFIVTNTNDTIYGSLKHGTPAQSTIKIQFTKEGTKDTRPYEPFEIKSWYDGKNDAHFESKLLDPGYTPYQYAVFMQRLNRGTVRVYEYWNTFGERGYIQTFLQRKDEKMREVDFINFKQQLIAYFDDFPQLGDKIDRGAFKKSELVKIVDEYNSWMNSRW